MENIVPGILRHLRAADIIRMAGLSAASLGQEYCRTGMVHSTQRQGARVTGVVDILHITNDVAMVPSTETNLRRHTVEVEIQNSLSWISNCSCNPQSSMLCSHAAALLFQWLAHPAAFVLVVEPTSILSPKHEETELLAKERDAIAAKPVRLPGLMKPIVVQGSPDRIIDILIQLGLSELRSIAREYEIVTNGMSKQQVADAILEALRQPDAVRRVATTLEKPQRQLLAAITLAGGSLPDDDLRGLFERFSLGQPNQLQAVLVVLQSKALLFRTSQHSSSLHRVGLSGTLLDIVWCVPIEVRNALRVTVPSTTFNPYQAEENGEVPTLQQVEPYDLLADLLLVARALDGYQLTDHDKRGVSLRDMFPSTRSTSSHSVDGSAPIPPPPDDILSPSALASLQAAVQRPPAFLRFAVRLLRLAGILHEDESATPCLRVLPGAARLLLSSARAEVAHDLFELWLTQSSYEELLALQEDGLRLRCRATSQSQPLLRSGELEAENSEARQVLVALLAQAPLNQWMSFQAFARFVYRLNPLFLQKRQRTFSSPHWWLEQEEGHPLRPTRLSDWLRGDIYYLSRLLLGPLHWWGICDVALSSKGRLLAFRLTPVAGWLFNGLVFDEKMQEQQGQSHSSLLEVVDADEVLVTCSSYAWSIIELMETFAQAIGIRHGRLCYRLTPKALGDALSRGSRPAPFLQLFQSVAMGEAQHDTPLFHLKTQLERWIANYGRVRIYTGVTLLETADSTVMRELGATTALDEQTVRSLHPTLLVLKKTGTERIVDDLKRRGQSPLLHDEEFYGAE